MSDGLTSGLCCPTCGERVIGVYHHFETVKDRATFEYLHAQRRAARGRKFRRRPCVVVLTIAEGRARMQQETA
jgi:hypothetical protein